MFLFLSSDCTLLGIGHVPFVTVAQATFPPCIQWGEPVLVSADVTNLTHNVSVSGANSPLVTVTTSDTKHCLELTSCQEYTLTVTPFSISPDYVGTSNNTNATIAGTVHVLLGSCSDDG